MTTRAQQNVPQMPATLIPQQPPQVIPTLIPEVVSGTSWHPAIFDVTSKPVYLADGTLIPGKAAIVRSDTEQVLSVMSDSYVPVSNKKVIDTFAEIANAAKIRWELGQAHLVRYGAKTMVDVKFPDLVWEAAKGDVIEMRATLVNGFDGFSAAGLDMGFWRLICTNGAYIGEKELSIRYVHMGQVNNRLVEEFKKYLTNKLDNTRTFAAALSQRNFRSEDAVTTVFEDSKSWMGQKYTAELPSMWEREKTESPMHNPLSAWIIYNVFTRVITHLIKSSQERRVAMWRKLSTESRKWNIS